MNSQTSDGVLGRRITKKEKELYDKQAEQFKRDMQLLKEKEREKSPKSYKIECPYCGRANRIFHNFPKWCRGCGTLIYNPDGNRTLTDFLRGQGK